MFVDAISNSVVMDICIYALVVCGKPKIGFDLVLKKPIRFSYRNCIMPFAIQIKSDKK